MHKIIYTKLRTNVKSKEKLHISQSIQQFTLYLYLKINKYGYI